MNGLTRTDINSYGSIKLPTHKHYGPLAIKAYSYGTQFWHEILPVYPLSLNSMGILFFVCLFNFILLDNGQ